MITSAFRGGTRDLYADLCIVGAGAAGIEMARLFDGTKWSVIVIEGGGFEFDGETQQLHRIMSVGKDISTLESLTHHLPPEYRRETRIRQFGGTTNIWSGKWKPHSPDDFESKDWMPFSGWPLSYRELLPFYREVARDHGIPDVLSYATGRRGGGLHEQARDLHYHQDPPLNFNTAFRATLERSKNVTVILNANAGDLIVDHANGDETDTVGHIVAKTLDGRHARVRAKVFVLAAGGLENARLLLNSRGRNNRPLGNRHDLVGRFFMDHPKGVWGRLFPMPNVELEERLTLECRDHEHVSRYFAFSERFRRRHGLLNHSTSFEPVHATSPTRAGVSGTPERRPDGNHSLNTLPRRLANRLIRPLGQGRPTAPGEVLYYELMHHLEQAPDRESRVRLSAMAKDELNEPVLVVDWRLSEFEIASLRRYFCLLREVLEGHHIGMVTYPPDGEDPRIALNGAHHHMGTTRMAASSTQGVVDATCKVFGVANLYVAGSSVFPTGGNANPTFTILALTRRLCSHLTSVLAQPQRSLRAASA